MASSARPCTIPTLSSPPVLSSRGCSALVRPPLIRCALFECQYSAVNSSGLINLGVAENSLCVDWLAQYFRSVFALDYNDFTYGTSLTGSSRLFVALRSFFAARFHARLPVEPAHIIAGAGCGAVLDALCAVLADPGDGILVAKPMYPGFAASFGCRNGVEVVGVDVPEGKENSIEALEAFERALEECKARGKRIRALVVCNPHNPLGFCYSREVLVEHCRFAEKHNLHLISDEIYALSTFGSHSRFTSLLSLDPLAEAGCSPSRLHVVYGASKDFGCNGLRIGVLVSQANPGMHVAIESSALLMKVSSAADMLWSSLLLDDPSLSTFLTLNLSRLRAAYARTVAFLTTHAIPFRPAEAGHFVWIDLTRYLPPGENDLEREGALAERMWAQGLNLGRGSAYCGTPGWFRLTFSVRPDFYEVGLRRLEQVLGLARECDGAVRLVRQQEEQEMKQVRAQVEEMKVAAAT